jgi:hypothetical protein
VGAVFFCLEWCSETLEEVCVEPRVILFDLRDFSVASLPRNDNTNRGLKDVISTAGRNLFPILSTCWPAH